MISINRKTVINIINNYNGIFSRIINNKDEFDDMQVGHVPYISDSVKAIVVKKEWYEDAEHGIVRYKILGRIEIV